MFGEIKNSQGERIDYTFHPGATDSSGRIAILGHGVTGNKDRPFVVALAEGLSKAGIPAIRISFSGNGASGGRFVDSTITKEVSDLGAVLDALPGRSVAYIGHSMGGAVGVIRASMDPRIRCLVSLAGMVHTAAFAEREFGNLTPGKDCMWEDENCPLSTAFMNDLREIQSLVGLAPSIRPPWLLVHGTADDVVLMQDSVDMFTSPGEAKQLIELEGAGHVFAGEATRAMVERVTAWLITHFR